MDSGAEMSHVGPRSVRIIEVIEVQTVRGAGIEGDPIRNVIEYWSGKGAKLAVFDEWMEEQRKSVSHP